MPPSPVDYVELRCRSAFSFLEGASNPEDLAERAAELGYPALALADRDGFYGSPRFHQATRAAGVRGLVGAEVTLAEGNGLPSLLLLCESPRGYRNLSRLLTVGHARCPKPASQVTWDEIEEHAGGLVGLARGDATLTPVALDQARGRLGAGRLWVDVSRHLDRAAEAAARRAVDLAEAARVPVLASNDVRHARPEGRILLDALTCLRWKTSLDAAGRLLVPNAERHLRPR
ncbi:MAG: PHP domain-containing protein, partial [Myxococcota bacterium]|nr:PHP domain-containing protein [Myxococcota bacterium]